VDAPRERSINLTDTHNTVAQLNERVHGQSAGESTLARFERRTERRTESRVPGTSWATECPRYRRRAPCFNAENENDETRVRESSARERGKSAATRVWLAQRELGESELLLSLLLLLLLLLLHKAGRGIRGGVRRW